MQSAGYYLGLAVLMGFGVPSLHGDLVTEPLRSFGLGDLQSVAVSADGRRLATAGRSGVYLWDLEGGVL